MPPLPVIVISVVSAWLASGGISVLLARFSGPVGAVQALAGVLFDADPEVTLAVLAWCVALLLQLLVVSVWRRVFSNMGGLIASALVGVAFSIASMALSSGMAVFQLEKMTLRTRAADEARAPVLASADAARVAALELGRATDALSQAAARKAELEISEGGTCAESNIAGEGPIQSRSTLHDEQAQEIGATVQNWAYAVEDAADALSIADPNQNAVNLRVDALRDLFRDQALLDARSVLSSMATDMDPTVGWTDNGRTHTCTDPDYAAAIANTLVVLEDIIGTSIATPRLTELTPAAGFESIWDAVSARIEGRDTDAIGETGLAIAFVVELIQVILIYIAAAVKNRRGEAPHRLDAFADGKSPKRPSHRKEKEAVIADTLRDRTIRYKGKNWFVSAVPPTPEEDAVIKDLDLPHPPPLFTAIPKGVMMWLPEFDAMRGYMKASAYDLRRIPSDVSFWLRRVERDRS